MPPLPDFYKQFSLFTYPGCYQDKLKSLPDSIQELGNLIRSSLIHRTTLRDGNTGSNADQKYGDMTKIPWHQQPQDDYLVTAAAMLAELYRRNDRGFILERKETEKLILTCRFAAILFASALKSKGMACRVRSGFTPYAVPDDKSWDHWVSQYYHPQEKRWVTVDVDCSWHDLEFDPYDMPEGEFDFAAQAWLDARSGRVEPNHFYNAGGFEGLKPISWALFYDFHCLMNREIIYLHAPRMVFGERWDKDRVTEKELKELDELAKLMLEPDENFEELRQIWEIKKKFRLLGGALL